MVAANEYDDLVELPFVRSHADGSIKSLIGKVVFLDKVRQVDPQLAQEAIADEGYLIVGDRVLFADDRTAVATVRGRVIFNDLEIERVRRIHERLEEHALEINLQFHPVTKRHIRQPVAPIQDRLLSVYTAEQELRERHSKELQDVSSGYRRLNDTASYYEWLRRRLDVEESRASAVYVISTRPLEVFIRHEQERSFMDWNQRAVEAGTKIRRIFVISESDLIQKPRRDALRSLLESKFDFGIAWASNVITYCSELTGGGLSIWDNVEVFLDKTYFVDPDAEDGEVPRLTRRFLIRDAVSDVYFGNHHEVSRSLAKFRSVDRIAKQTFGERPTYHAVLNRWLLWAQSQQDQSSAIKSAIVEVEAELTK